MKFNSLVKYTPAGKEHTEKLVDMARHCWYT